MHLCVTMMVLFCNLIGSAVNDVPVYVAALAQPAASVVQAADPVTIEAPLEQTGSVVVAPVSGEEPSGTWSIAGQVSVGEYALPYRIEGYLKAADAEPVLVKMTIGSDGLGLSFEVSKVIEQAVQQYSDYLDSVLQMVAQFRLEGVGLRFCVDILCVTAEVNAEGSLFDRRRPITKPLWPDG